MDILANVDCSEDNETPDEYQEEISNMQESRPASVVEDACAQQAEGHPSIPLHVETSYGKREDEKQMRGWLDMHLLPQSTGDFLLQQGARCISDVFMLIEECPEILEELPKLDRLKLRKAVGGGVEAVTIVRL